MGAYKDWAIGMVEGGHSDHEIAEAERRIKGTLADPLVRRLAAAQDRNEDDRDQDRQQ